MDVLRLCAAAGLAKAGRLALDGTKMKANASLDANRAAEGLQKEIAGMLYEAAAKDAEEPPCGRIPKRPIMGMFCKLAQLSSFCACWNFSRTPMNRAR